MKYAFLSLLCVIIISVASSAQQVSGRVLNAEDKSPVQGANVFINNGSRGTITNKDGYFELKDVNLTEFELVISFISYETIVVHISPLNINSKFRIEMTAKKSELEEIVITAPEKNGWEKHGKFFTELFIGTSDNARQCRILNPKVIKFYYNKTKNILTVSATDQIEIENNALGYTINYQLENMAYDYKKGMLTYSGFTNFVEKNSNRERKKTLYATKRKKAYQGSIMHFMRALYSNSVSQEGFSLRELRRLYKEEPGDKVLYNMIMAGNFSNFDTSQYFIQLMKPSVFTRDPIVYVYAKNTLSIDSIRYKENGEVFLSFPYNLQVTFNNEVEEFQYALQRQPRTHDMPERRKVFVKHQQSIIGLAAKKAVVVTGNGLYFEPLDLFTEEYWAWEKLAELLPIDYVPE